LETINAVYGWKEKGFMPTANTIITTYSACLRFGL
jgi:hypothetical protein